MASAIIAAIIELAPERLPRGAEPEFEPELEPALLDEWCATAPDAAEAALCEAPLAGRTSAFVVCFVVAAAFCAAPLAPFDTFSDAMLSDP